MQRSDEHERFELALVGTRLGLWDWNMQTGETVFNERWAEIVGYTLDELQPISIDTWMSLAHPDDLARSEAAIAEHVSGVAPYYDVEARMRHKDGHWVWVRDRGALFERSADGRPLRMIGTHEDITDRITTQKSLAESEQRFAQMFMQHSAVMLLVEPTTGTIIDANYAAEEYYGYPVTTLRGMPIEKINVLPPDEIARRRAQAMRGGGDFIFPHRLADGEIRTVEVMSSPITINEKQLLFSVIADVTEREDAFAELQATAATFDSLSEVLFVTDRNGVVLRANSALTDRLGWRPEDVIGAPANILAGKAVLGEEADFVSAIQQGNHGPFRLEGPVQHADGRETPALVNISPIEGIQGEVTGFITLISDLADHVRAERANLELAENFDPLTGLPNRAHFAELLDRRLSVARTPGHDVALITLDIDRFKEVNDSYGHSVGDALLVVAAERLKAQLRSGCIMARFGGNQFAVLAEDVAGLDDATTRAENLLAALAPPCRLDNGLDVFLTACIGMSVLSDPETTADLALQEADAALHDAKEVGPGTVRQNREDLVEQSRARLLTESRLRHAWVNQELRVRFQPQVDMGSGRIIGAEALLAWTTPEGEVVRPADFVPVAERIGLISEIGAWVLEQTCLAGARWIAEGLPAMTMSVNVSPKQLEGGEMAEEVGQILSQTAFPAERLVLELTESALLSTGDATLDLLNALDLRGIHLSIDDFGTGYSSFAYLRRFPLDQLKIDRSFVSDMDVNPDDRAICAAIIGLAHTLGLRVLAEGIETEEQLTLLRDMDCDEYQGFHFSVPLPASEFADLVRSRL